MKTYHIPAANLPALQAEVDSMNRRAEKIGCPAIVLETLGHSDSKDELGRISRTYEVKLSGELPSVAGWSLVAVLNHNEANENIVKTIPGETLPESYRSASSWCDHCKTNRYRTDTFVLRNESGDFKQVGRNCLADFLRSGDAETLAQRFQFLADIVDMCEDAEDYGWRGFRQETAFNLSGFLSIVQICTKCFGWRSVSNCDEGQLPTADIAFEYNSSPFSDCRREIESFLKVNPISEQDRQLVQNAIAWAKTQTGELSEYIYNLKVIAESDYVTRKTYRLAASMLASYRRATDAQEKKQKAQTDSKYFGTIGKREVFTLTLENVVQLAGEYGVTNLHIFRDENGNRAVWFASGMPLNEKSDVYKVKATVKAHNTRDGVAQTILTRVTEQ